MNDSTKKSFVANKATVILSAERIEDCISFWESRLGFQCVQQVPGDDGIGFAILVRDTVSIMYQTRASIAKDIGVKLESDSRTILYLDVDDIAPLQDRFSAAETVVSLRKTFYGATEIFVRDPAGNVIGIAQHD